MSDDRVRTLERRWRASGSLEDEVEWIRERARCGQLELGRGALAGAALTLSLSSR